MNLTMTRQLDETSNYTHLGGVIALPIKKNLGSIAEVIILLKCPYPSPRLRMGVNVISIITKSLHKG